MMGGIVFLAGLAVLPALVLGLRAWRGGPHA
jgi:hypothetical protein